MDQKAWWLVTALIAALGIIGFIIPGLLIMNPMFFVYGGVVLLVAVLVTGWLLVKRRSGMHGVRQPRR